MSMGEQSTFASEMNFSMRLFGLRLRFDLRLRFGLCLPLPLGLRFEKRVEHKTA